jgi:hypothetical protein
MTFRQRFCECRAPCACAKYRDVHRCAEEKPRIKPRLEENGLRSDDGSPQE